MSSAMRPIGGVWTLALAAAALAGCPGSLDDRFLDTGTMPMSTACSSDDIQQTVFNTSCTMVGCHDSSAMPSGGLDLLSAGAQQRIVGVRTPAGQTCSSSTLSTLVVPGDPTHSLLFLKVEPTPPCGSRMPFGASTALTDRQIECIRSWIAALPPSTNPTDGGPPAMDAAVDVPVGTDVVHTDVVGPTDTPAMDTAMPMDVPAMVDTSMPDVVRLPDVATDHSVPTDTAVPVDVGVDAGVDP